MQISRNLLLYALLSSYCLAGCLMEHFTLFYAWTLVTNDADLKRIQHSTGMRALYIYVVPKFIITIWTITLLREEPLLWISLFMLLASWTSSFAVQIPLQLKVRENADRVALMRLVKTTWVRTVAMVSHCAVMLCVILAKAQADRGR